MTNLIEPDLSYKIVGLCMAIQNELGRNHKEKYYQRALELDLIKNLISYKREIRVPLEHSNEEIGYYCLDFLIKNKLIVELKSKINITRTDIKQVLSYLETNDMELGIIINFGRDKLEIKRILNPKYSGYSHSEHSGKIREN